MGSGIKSTYMVGQNFKHLIGAVSSTRSSRMRHPLIIPNSDFSASPTQTSGLQELKIIGMVRETYKVPHAGQNHNFFFNFPADNLLVALHAFEFCDFEDR